MATGHLVPADLRERYLVREWRNAAGVLATACPGEWDGILAVLRVFQLRAIDVGVILTRSTGLHGIFATLGKAKSYGTSTTHHEKLCPRLEGGGGGGCPVLTFAITPELYVDDISAASASAARTVRPKMA